jgi:shikimate kinase
VADDDIDLAVPPWHVVLVGLPGTGKTSVGRRLAKELERPFADVDEQVELEAGTSVRRLFREQGEEPFRALETRVLGRLLDHPAPLVLAAGGGVVTRPENRALLRGEAGAGAGPDARPPWPAAGLGQPPGAVGGAPSGGGAAPERHRAWVVWLRASAEFLAARTDPTHRPLLADDPVGALARLEDERAPLYAAVADEVVDVEPFHAPHVDEDAPAAVKPKHALARHVVALLTGSTSAPAEPNLVPPAPAEREVTP